MVFPDDWSARFPPGSAERAQALEEFAGMALMCATDEDLRRLARLLAAGGRSATVTLPAYELGRRRQDPSRTPPGQPIQPTSVSPPHTA
jgi:hypothetical protein